MSVNGESPTGEFSEFETQFEPRSNDDDILWEVVEIVAERGKKYRVRWAGNDPKTGRPWPLDWVHKHDCTDHLVEEWKRKKAEKRRRSNNTSGTSTAKSRSSTLSKLSSAPASRKTRFLAEENLLTDDEEPPRAQPSTSKRKLADVVKELSDVYESAETPEPKRKKRKIVPRQEPAKKKRKNVPRTLVSRSDSIESDADEGVASGDVDEEIVVTKCGPPARKRRIPNAPPSIPSKRRTTTMKTTTNPERPGSPYSAFLNLVLSPSESDSIHKSKKPPVSRFVDRKTNSEIAVEETHSETHSPVALCISPPAHLHSRTPPLAPAPALGRQPILSPRARARLQIFDHMMGITLDEDNIDYPSANMGESADYGDFFEPHDLPPNSPKFPSLPPPPMTTATAERKKQPRDSPFSVVVPETESSQSQPSLPKPRVNEKNADARSLSKPPSRPTSPSEKLQSVPPIAVMRPYSSSISPSHTGHVPSSSDVPVRPRKPATRPIPRISPQTFRKAVEPFTSELDNEPPMSSIESFPSPRKGKGKQRYSADADELQGSSDKEAVPGRTDAELRARGEVLYEQALMKKELLRVADKPPLKKTFSDVARSRVPLVMTANGKQSTSDTHLFASGKRDRQGDLVVMQQMEDAYVDLSGGNSTTIDTFTQSAPQDREVQRILLREETEESTQEALLGGNPALLAPKVNVAEKPEVPQELVIDDVDVCCHNDGVQPSPPAPAERSGSNQLSAHIDDLQVASMIVNPSQGQPQEIDDEEAVITFASSPIRSPQNNTNATMGQLNHALSALNKKSEEIQALQHNLTLEREKSSKLEDEVKAARHSTAREASASIADPVGAMESHPAVSELADVRAKLGQEREVWEAERRKWEEELAKLTTERDRLETDARGADEIRASWDADRAAFQLERELWEGERDKLGLQVADALHERNKWSEERASLADQITSLTETCGAFEAERAQWEQEQNAIIAERAVWASERESWALLQAASVREDASRDAYREAMELQSATWEAGRVEWASNKEMWGVEREKWSAERVTLVEEREALTTDVARLNSLLEAMARSKALADKDSDFFRNQYRQASDFATSTRAENVELEQKAAIAEGQARDGVALIKSMFESQVKALKEDVDQWRGVSVLLQEKDRRTDDLIRQRAAEQPELVERCRQLEDQVDSLQAELELAHQKFSLEHNKLPRTFSELRKRQQAPELHSVKLTYPEVEPGEIIGVTSLPDQDGSDWTQMDALAADLSAEVTDDDECGLYPCKWGTGAGVIDQCQQAFDCREDLDRHMHDYHYCHQLQGNGSS